MFIEKNKLIKIYLFYFNSVKNIKNELKNLVNYLIIIIYIIIMLYVDLSTRKDFFILFYLLIYIEYCIIIWICIILGDIGELYRNS